MSKNRVYTLTFIIIILGFLAGDFVFPNFLNLGLFPNLPFKLGLDLQGGVHLVYQADLSSVPELEHKNTMEGLRDVIERRINVFGIREPQVQTQNQRLIVEIAGVINPSDAIDLIGKTPFLEFREQRDADETQKILDKLNELKGKNPEEMKDIENLELALEDPYFKPTQLTGKYLKNAEVIFDQFGQPAISLQFTSEGEKIFEELTEKNVGKPLAIYIDNILVSNPVVQEKISGGRAQITGKFTIKEARDLAKNLNAGALPVPINLISQQSVGPLLGAQSLKDSLRAGIFGFLAIVIFITIFYRIPGLVASLVLLIYVFFVLSFFKLFSVTLTLAGIGGFILSIGMAVDANILVFARMREELRDGKTFSISLIDGFRRAWPSIRDGNLTTILVALILFSFGSSFIKGFALALIIGILISMFSAVFITRIFLSCFEGTKLTKINWLWR